MTVQIHRRDAFLVAGHQVHGLEPQGERQPGEIEDRADGNGDLAVAAVTLPELASAPRTTAVMTAVRTTESPGPAPWISGVETGIFGSVAGEKLVRADVSLKRPRVVHHGNIVVYQNTTG